MKPHRLLLPALTLAVVAVVGVGWLRERMKAAAFPARVAALSRAQQELARLQAEGDRLRGEILRAVPQESAIAAEPAPIPIAAPATPVAWGAGEWTPATAWRNEGRATPRAMTTTLLWAAAHGELATLRDVFHFDGDARARVQAWWDSLPPSGRVHYAGPEDLFAGATLAAIAPGQAQLSWLHEATPDRAIVGLLVAGSEPVASHEAVRLIAGEGNLPPSLADRSRYKVIVLNLQRSADGWRVVVPSDAVDTLARRVRASVNEPEASRR